MALTANQLAVALFNAAVGGYKSYVDGKLAKGDAAAAGDLLIDSGLASIADNGTFAYALVEKATGGSLTPAQVQQGADVLVGYMNAGMTRAGTVLEVINFLSNPASVNDATFGSAAQMFQNKVVLADAYAGTSTDLATLHDVVVTATATDFTLTQKADNFTGNAADNVFLAPVTQNETGSGALANTFETGDVLNGGAGRDVLRADLIGTGTIQDWQISAVISATTTGVEEVYLRAQRPDIDNTIDAEKMDGVEQWWSDNSRATINIEDIRTDTAATTFGMRMTDPAGVSLNAYFNALYLEGDVSATSAMTLNIYEGPLGAPNATTQLENITVREIAFTVEGQQITLDTEAIRAADTWVELETALNDALAAIEGAETITLTNRGNGQFVFEDSEGREFQVNEGEALVLSVTNNITVTNSLAVGREEVTGPVISNAVLDGAGNGSQGGALNIGAMSGLRGVEELNLSVDRDSHVTSITSFNQTPGQYFVKRDGSANEHLEVVDVTSIGAEGDLTVGRTNPNAIDGRVLTWSDVDDGTGVVGADGVVDGGVLDPTGAFVATRNGNSGFINLRELNTADFNGALNVALTLDNNTISRYLDAATEAVTFSYNGGAQNDIFNIADVSNLGVSGDQDFAMEVDMGAGDDRLVLTGFTARAVSVDGGEGENSIVVAQSHGTTAANTFEAFANFQTYEVEGNGNTVHDFTSMSGIENVVIATGDSTPTAGGNTQLIDLEAAQNVTVSGKNQTVGNASTADQNFGTIQLTNDAGTDRTITLDNTARLSNSTNGVRQDGVLTVNNLVIDTNPATTVGATRTVTIVSDGERTSANAIADFDGRDVQSLRLTGTQDLTINVDTIADQAANTAAGTDTSTSVQINASGLTGNLNLALDGTMLNNFGATPPTPAQIDTITGTAGANDTVMFHGALTAGNAVTASGIEKVQLGSFGDGTPATVGDTMFGDLVMDVDASGTLNAANLGVSNFAVANLMGGGVTLSNLSGGATVDVGDANRDTNGARVLSQTLVEQINLQSSALTAATTASTLDINRLDVIALNTVTNIAVGDDVAGATANTGGFRTINLNVARDASLAATVSDANLINLDVGSQARTLDINGGAAGRSNVSAQAIQGEVQAIDFTGLTVQAAGVGNITVGGVVVALANNDNAAAIAGKVAVALGGVGAGTAIGDATFTAIGETVVAQYTAAYGDVAAATLALGAETAQFVGPVTAAATAVVTDNVAEVRATAVAQVADTLNLATGGNTLGINLETIDLSGYNGQVTLVMDQGPLGAAQTDVSFVMSSYDATVTLNNGGGGAGAVAAITHNSVFDFNAAGSTTVPTQWVITNVVDGKNGDVNNTTLFDLRDLGIANYAQVEVLYVNDGDVLVDLYGNALAAGSAVIRSEAQGNTGVETWEIVVTGVAGAMTDTVNSIDATNFIF